MYIKNSIAIIFLLFVFQSFVLANDFSQKALKEVFREDFQIGAALNETQIYGNDPIANPIIKKHFNTITSENILKWENIHPEPALYDLKAADKYVVLGERNGMFIVGHTLVWHSQTPAWVFEDRFGNRVSRAVLLDRLEQHIRNIVGTYRGRIHAWDVVNEALNEDGTLHASPWLEIIGEDYIEKAFRFAHEADPTAELYYNDYALESEPKRKGAIKLIKKLLNQGVPLTAVGLQGHNNLSFPSRSEQDQTIKDFARIGVKVMISELDISVLPNGWDYREQNIPKNSPLWKYLNPYPTSLPAEVQDRQEQRFEELFDVYYNNRKNIKRITFWNVTDADSWLNYLPINGRTDYPLLFDRNGKAKPALSKIISNRQRKSY